MRCPRPRHRAAGEISYRAIEKSDKSPSAPQLPRGFLLDVEFLSSEEEARYLERMAVLPFETVAMRGRKIRRQMLTFGVGFGTNFQSMVEAAPIPRELYALRGRAAEWAGTARGELTQALIQRYPRGATSGDEAADLDVTLAEALRSIERSLFAQRDVKNDTVHGSLNGRHDIALARAIAAPFAKSQFVIGKHRSRDDGDARDTMAKSC